MTHRIILVSGPPGAGKSTLAAPLAERLGSRAAAAGHHPVHVDREISADVLAEYERPLGVGTLISVDTSRPVDLAAVVGRIRAEFRVPSAGSPR